MSGALTPDETHRDSWRLGRESTESCCVAVTREFVREYGSFAYPKFPNYRVVLQKSLDRQRTGEWNLIAQRVLGFFHTLVEMEAQIRLPATNTPYIPCINVESESSIPPISIVRAKAATAQKDSKAVT